MTIRENQYPVHDLIVPHHILVSVSDKTRLLEVVAGILNVNEHAHFYSTGGTGKELVTILRDCVGSSYTPVETFTGAPEMEGGLVKTLHPKVHGGLLAERDNPAHIQFLEEAMLQPTGIPGVYFDIVVNNLYPFERVIEEGATPEQARVNIDIGGPAMVMAAAKNWHSVAVLTSPDDYFSFVQILRNQGGTTLKQRFRLAREAFFRIGQYREAIAEHFLNLDFEQDIEPGLTIKDDTRH